jgi:protein tyrosine phosphatase (PTP) superfamily phosphohydrolase (DUF442 family)
MATCKEVAFLLSLRGGTYMKKAILPLLFILFFAACPAQAEQEVQDKEVSFVREIFNFHVIAPGVMRGSQPSEEAIRLLKEYCGLKTIIDLRGKKKDVAQEAGVAKELGIDFINITMNAREKQGLNDIDRCLEIMHDKSRQPVFVHCHSGKDRTGMVCAAYRIKYDGWTLDEALSEMLAYGYSRSCCLLLEESLSEWDLRRENAPGQ